MESDHMKYKEIESTGLIACRWIKDHLDHTAARIVRACLADFLHYKMTQGSFYKDNYRQILEEVRDTWDVPPKVAVRIEKAIQSLQHES